MKRDTNKIQRLVTFKDASNYDRNESFMVPHKKMERTGASWSSALLRALQEGKDA